MPSNVFGYPYPLDTDPVRAGAADIEALARFTEGRAGDFIELVDNGTYSIGSGGWYTLSLNTVTNERDTHNRLTPTGGGVSVAAGWVDIQVQIKWNGATTAGGRRFVAWGPVTGGPSTWQQSTSPYIPSNGGIQMHREIVRLATTQNVFACCYQDCGTATPIQGGRLVIRYLSQL